MIPIQEQTGVEEDQLVAKMLLLQVHTLVRLSQQSISLALSYPWKFISHISLAYVDLLVYGVYFGLECQLFFVFNEMCN